MRTLANPAPKLGVPAAPLKPAPPARPPGRRCHPPRRVARERPYPTRQTQAGLRHLTSITSAVSSERKTVLPGFWRVGRKSRPPQRRDDVEDSTRRACADGSRRVALFLRRGRCHPWGSDRGTARQEVLLLGARRGERAGRPSAGSAERLGGSIASELPPPLGATSPPRPVSCLAPPTACFEFLCVSCVRVALQAAVGMPTAGR